MVALTAQVTAVTYGPACKNNADMLVLLMPVNERQLADLGQRSACGSWRAARERLVFLLDCCYRLGKLEFHTGFDIRFMQV